MDDESLRSDRPASFARPISQTRRTAPAIWGLGLVVCDQQLFLPAFPEVDTKTFATGSRVQLGGPVPVALAQLRRLGWRCRFLGLWADDDAGRTIEQRLRSLSIGFHRRFCRCGLRSGLAHVWIEAATGRRTVASLPPEPVSQLAVSPQVRRWPPAVLHLDAWGGAVTVELAQAVAAAGGVVSLDSGSIKPATERLLPLASVLNCPARFIRDYCGTGDLLAGARMLQQAGPQIVTVTDGERGAGLVTKTFADWRPAFDVPAVDSCGAGDVFCGGLLHAVLSGWPPERMLRFAMATAALKVSRAGNDDALATAAEVEAFCDRR